MAVAVTAVLAVTAAAAAAAMAAPAAAVAVAAAAEVVAVAVAVVKRCFARTSRCPFRTLGLRHLETANTQMVPRQRFHER
jgi:hypothetical protein